MTQQNPTSNYGINMSKVPDMIFTPVPSPEPSSKKPTEKEPVSYTDVHVTGITKSTRVKDLVKAFKETDHSLSRRKVCLKPHLGCGFVRVRTDKVDHIVANLYQYLAPLGKIVRVSKASRQGVAFGKKRRRRRNARQPDPAESTTDNGEETTSEVQVPPAYSNAEYFDFLGASIGI